MGCTSSTPSQTAAQPPQEIPQQILQKLEQGFAAMHADEQCHSLLKKYLTRQVLDELKTRKTKMGATLYDVVQSGMINLDSGCGVYAPDTQSYTVFAPLFNPVIEEYHQGFKPTDKQPAKNFGDVDKLIDLDPEGKYIISTRVRCGRSIANYPLNPLMTEQQYKELEASVKSHLEALEGQLKGTYYPLSGMQPQVQKQLIEDHFLFKEGDRFLQAAHACQHWPVGRGIYHNDDKTFLMWVNEEDHLRIISMQKGGNLKQVVQRLVKAIDSVEHKQHFARDKRLGYLTFCPTNLGTTIRASVHIKLPHLGKDRKMLEEIAAKYNLQVRGTSGEHTDSTEGVYDISNKRRLGLSEYEAIMEMQHGVLQLIKKEKESEMAHEGGENTEAAVKNEEEEEEEENKQEENNDVEIIHHQEEQNKVDENENKVSDVMHEVHKFDAAPKEEAEHIAQEAAEGAIEKTEV